MNLFWGRLAGVTTLFTMLSFLAIWAWAWLPRHRRAFDALACVPMHDAEEDA
jgi:cytochrome c oxidase cbb3-type subunit 4